MSSEVDAIEKELREFKADVKKRFDNLHDDLSELTSAMRDLIKLDGYIQRVADLTDRIGSQVDTMEVRVRTLEVSNAGNTKTVGRVDRMIDRVLWVVVVAVLAYISIEGG